MLEFWKNRHDLKDRKRPLGPFEMQKYSIDIDAVRRSEGKPPIATKPSKPASTIWRQGKVSSGKLVTEGRSTKKPDMSSIRKIKIEHYDVEEGKRPGDEMTRGEGKNINHSDDLTQFVPKQKPVMGGKGSKMSTDAYHGLIRDASNQRKQKYNEKLARQNTYRGGKGPKGQAPKDRVNKSESCEPPCSCNMSVNQMFKALKHKKFLKLRQGKKKGQEIGYEEGKEQAITDVETREPSGPWFDR